MSTQQDIYAAGSENRPPMLNKENYVPWSSLFLWYAKSRSNGKLIYNSIINGPYVRRMIPEPGDQNCEVPVNETFHEQTDDELTKKELKQDIWLCVQQMMKGSDIRIQEKKAKLFNEWERFTSTDGESIESYYHRFSKLMNDFKRNKHFPEKTSSNLEFLNNLQPEWSRHVTIVHQKKELNTTNYTSYLTTAMNMALVLMAKEFKLNYSTPTNNYQRISSNPHNRQIAQPGMDIGQDRQMQMVRGNGGNQFIQHAGQNIGNHIGNQNGLIVVPGIANQNPNGNGNVVVARAKGNAIGNNGNQIRCYNCKGFGHLARNCTVRPRR
ncbi:copia protein, partial [Tanacetum coccineum]